ncbi:hypothetical protein S40285_02039 [Stachybotrys chlorohalonatus IBT 40285]|uniref:GPI anchored serine-rich protein n=1 Tax=Stachybotrys chlorohalonatus (strain IBT 40285) TaxID=1283841 RepID=A0A084R1F4_STAC4|nr:hypothetical protein S40285_02039 [Stachybotrys chlorohalonata IBT 40285]
MQFSVAAVVLATSVMAYTPIVSTAYQTELVTVTACPPTVPDCPAESQTVSVSTTYIPIPTTTSEMVIPTTHANQTSMVHVPTSVETESPGVPTEVPEVPEHPEFPTSAAPLCPSSSVIAVTKSYTTVLTSVEYSTVEVPCPTSTESPSASYTPPAVPTPPPAGNTTVPTPPPTAGAGSVTGSVVFAAVAGAVAVFLA